MWGEGNFLYAYQRQNTREYEDYVRLRVVRTAPPERVRPLKQKQIKRKKRINPVVKAVRLSVVLSCLFAFLFLVYPTCYNNLIKQIIRSVNSDITNEMTKGMAFKDYNPDSGIDVYTLANPTVEYMSNDLFLNRLLLTPTLTKTHSEITTMYQTNEMLGLKSQLQELMKSYPMINPAIYVWEYEKGQYVDINSDKQFSAASIIKLPVLVRMFKSIEANQMTIYDEMVLTDYYKSSGSGDLQYMPTGRKFTLDALAKTMIQDSDNSATNMIMSKLGGMDDVNIGLRDWGISKTYVRTWLPDLDGTNKTTAQDMAKILYNLDNPGFLNINSREYIIDYMSHVKNNKLIAAGLGEGATLIHKTGDIGKMLGDAGIVYGPGGRKYIVAIIVNRPYNSPLGKDFIVHASRMIYNYIY